MVSLVNSHTNTTSKRWRGIWGRLTSDLPSTRLQGGEDKKQLNLSCELRADEPTTAAERRGKNLQGFQDLCNENGKSRPESGLDWLICSSWLDSDRDSENLSTLGRPSLRSMPGGHRRIPLSSEYGTSKIVKPRFWPWLSGEGPQNA